MTSEDEDEPELVGATGCSRNLRKSPSEVHSSSSHITSSSNVRPYNKVKKCYCLVFIYILMQNIFVVFCFIVLYCIVFYF